MGRLFGKKDDGLYRGDAPASAPGVDGLALAAYQGPSTSAFGQPPVQATPVPYDSPEIQAGPVPRNYPFPGTPAGQPSAQVPPELAAALAYGQQWQRVVKRTSTNFRFGFLVSLLLAGGLVVGGFVVVNNVQEGIDNPSDSGSAPAEPFQGVVGTPGEVTFENNSYKVTIQSATSQPSAAWDSSFAPALGPLLVIELSLTRTDSSVSASQITSFDWLFTTESGRSQEAESSAGGYEPLLSTLTLASGETATGLVAFDTPASVGAVSLTSDDGTWAQWPITATAPTTSSGVLGIPVHPELARAPFTVTVANPRWLTSADPAVSITPRSGSYLVLDLSVTLDAGQPAHGTNVTIRPSNWLFTPDDDPTSREADFGVTGALFLIFNPGEPTTASTLIAVDTAQRPGTLSLINVDGSVLATWPIPAL